MADLWESIGMAASYVFVAFVSGIVGYRIAVDDLLAAARTLSKRIEAEGRTADAADVSAFLRGLRGE